MKQIMLFLMLTSLLCGQDVNDGEVDGATPPVELDGTTPPVELTEAPLAEAPAKKYSTDRRNWIYAAGSAVAAAIAIIVVSLNPGDPPSSDHHH